MLGSQASQPASRRQPARAASTVRRAKTTKRAASRPSASVAGVARPIILLVLILLAASGLVARLVFWQVMEAPRLALMATQQTAGLLVQQPLRGQIVDAAGNPLATDVTQNLVYADPSKVKNPVRAATLLAPILGQSERLVEDKLSGYSTYVQIAPRVPPSVADRIQALGLNGIFLTPTVERYYPEGSLASQLLGFYGGSGAGNYGLEQFYDPILSGKAGIRSSLVDTAGNKVHFSDASPAAAENGANLYLTVDSYIQNEVETELRKAVKAHTADGGTIIVMDPRTGYILGMAGSPSYNPNSYQKWANSNRSQDFLDPAISWTYEPGSTFKIITMAAGLDSHVIVPTSAFDDTGVFHVADATLHNWTGGAFGWETMTQVLQHSANVGAAHVSSLLGRDRFYRYVNRFGLGHQTGIDLAGEEGGILPLPGQKSWTIVNQFTNSFGQGLSITPIQLIRAVAAVANDGVMMKPQIVKRIVYDAHVIDRPPVVQGHPISAASAHTLTQMLVQSAIGGEAQFGLVKGYNIAAKTGTANVADGHGGYIPNDTIASIVGYAPAYHPRFAVLVIINHPRDTPWGSMAAAPVLHNLFQELFMYYHIPPSSSALYQ